MDLWQIREGSSLCPIKSFYLWIHVTWAKSTRKQVLQSAVSGDRIKERHFVRCISWINQPPGSSLWFFTHSGVHWEHWRWVHCYTGTHHSSWITEKRVVFRTNWCDGGEWMAKRKSGIWHLAARAGLWPRLVECWAEHINNKPSPSGWLMMFFTLITPARRRPQKGVEIQALFKHKLSYIPSLIYQKSNNFITELQNNQSPPTFPLVVLATYISKGAYLARVCKNCTMHGNNYKLLAFPCKTHDFTLSHPNAQASRGSHSCLHTDPHMHISSEHIQKQLFQSSLCIFFYLFSNATARHPIVVMMP